MTIQKTKTTLLFVITLFVMSAGFLLAQDNSAESPNVIFILADDLGYGDLGCYGQERIQTPTLDQMAREGMRFTDFYAGAPMCAPSRCSFMTGLHMGHARIRFNNLPVTPDRVYRAIEKQQRALAGKAANQVKSA